MSITFKAGVSRKWCTAASNNFIIGPLSAFNFSGRLRVAMRIGPASSVSRCGSSDIRSSFGSGTSARQIQRALGDHAPMDLARATIDRRSLGVAIALVEEARGSLSLGQRIGRRQVE